MRTTAGKERERAAQIVRDEWHRAVAEFDLSPGSPIEKVTARILSRLHGETLPRAPGIDPKTREYSTAQMMRDEMFGGDTSQPLFD